MLTIQNLAYRHANGMSLFNDIQLNLNPGEKIGIVGKNGVGKSLLLQIIAGRIRDFSGECQTTTRPYYVPQLTDPHHRLSIESALNICRKRQALHAILQGKGSVNDYETLDDDWHLEERAREALQAWGVGHVSLDDSCHLLSGGQKARVF